MKTVEELEEWIRPDFREIDVVFPYRINTRFHNHEIRFALRSIEKHLKNYRQIWIIGDEHPELQNVNHIPFPDKTSISDTNVMHKMTRACQEAGITEDFLMFNDDHYLLTDFDAPTFPYFYFRTIPEFLTTRNPDGYHRRVKNTGEYLLSKGLPIKFFDVHTPIIFNKKKFLSLVSNGPDWTPPNQFVLKSIYCNSLKIPGVSMPDRKGQVAPPEGTKIFSTTPRVPAKIQRFLFEQFPKKCRYERRDFES